jgi:phospholipid/cholesterol/gamma-HCH transport system ATP-binding protein
LGASGRETLSWKGREVDGIKEAAQKGEMEVGRHHGRQRLRQEHAAATSDRAQPPAHGEVLIGGENLWRATPEDQERIKRRFGVLFQSGGLWSSMTLAENVALPLETYADLSPTRIRDIVSLKLALVGLSGFEAFYPSEISGGMQKLAGLARAMALDPDILFFDEPSAGLDPISSRRLDELILELRDSLGATVVVVTHELASIFTIGNNSVFLDPETKTMIAQGDPKALRDTCPDPKVGEFLTRGEAEVGTH